MAGEISRTKIAVVAFLAALCLAPRAQAASPPEIDASVRATLEDFFREVWSGRELANKAVAILVFPTIVKAGFGIGGEYGEGALHIRGRTAGYYNIISASIGFQFGAQARSAIIMFMTEAALADFQRTDGWKVGVDGSIAIIAVGAGGQIDTNSIRSPVIGFIFDQKGLMYNLTAARRERLEARDREQPRGDGGTAFKAASLLPHVEKHVAQKIFGDGLIADEPEQPTVNGGAMPGEQHLHGELVARCDALNQHLNGGVGSRGARKHCPGERSRAGQCDRHG